MNQSSKKVKILNITSRHVEFLFLDNNSTLRIPIKVFEKRWDNGLYELTNPERLRSLYTI